MIAPPVAIMLGTVEDNVEGVDERAQLREPHAAVPADPARCRAAQNGCKLAHTVLWEYSYERLKSAQYLGRHGVVLT